MSTLARLSFWVSPESLGDFEAAYRKKITPILRQHDLEESSEPGRATVEGVFSRLFEFETPAEVVEKRRRLQRDPTFRGILRDLGTTFGAAEETPLRFAFGTYATPAGQGKAVKAGPGMRQGVWHSFDVSDGLQAPSIYDILQNREGDLWFACEKAGGGVSRYDGDQFVTFTVEDGLAHDAVFSMLEDREGNLWFGTDGGGVSRYDGEQFVTFTVEDGLAHNAVFSMLEDREGNLWFGTMGGGVSRYNGEQFVTFTAEHGLARNWVCCIAENRDATLWFGTGYLWHVEGGGVSRYDGEIFVTFTAADGLAHNTVNSISQDREGNLWFGTMGGGVSRYDGERFINFTQEDGLANKWVHAILLDQEERLWFGTNRGVSRYDGSTFITFTPEDGLPHHQVLSILEDREGDLWLGTAGGMSRYDGNQLASFTTEDGLVNNGVMSVLEDREGQLWFGTWAGISRYDGKEWTTEPGLGDNVWAIVEDRQGNLWFGSSFGGAVTRYDGEDSVTFTTADGLASNSVNCILADRKGNLWFGTDGGVTRYDRSQFVSFTTEDGLANEWVRAILEDRKGNLWFGTGEGGVRRYDGSTFVTFTTEDGLAHHHVFAILEDQEGNLWFGTKGGVSRYSGGRFVTFTKEDGLAHDVVFSMLEDRKGNLWFGTFGGGVSRYDGLVFQNLSRRDGLLNNAIQEILQDRTGSIWMATEGGVVRYRPGHTPPRIRITDIVADRRYGPVEKIQISAYQQYIAFEFQGRSFRTHTENMAYVYRLGGYDSDWRPAYTSRVEYHDIPLGEYVFEVKAVDQDLNYSEPTAVQVTVEPDPRQGALTEALRGDGPAGEFVGESAALRKTQVQLREVAATDLTVLILGETGTGKGLAAHVMHKWSGRACAPFTQVHCGAIPEALVESELFGHEKGAFTGAISRKLGKVELAQGGTLFLDEIGDMPLESQVKLLRFLEEREFERVGGTETLEADVRIVAATNRDLRGMIDTGTFREDLYYRLQVFTIRVPPLRDRRDDIPLLAIYFAQRMAAHLSKDITDLTPDALSILGAYAWPGNVRELEHTMQRAVIVNSGPTIRAEDISLEVGRIDEPRVEKRLTLEEHERRYIQEILEETGWTVAGPNGAAAILGLHEATLRGRMKKLGVVRR